MASIFISFFFQRVCRTTWRNFESEKNNSRNKSKSNNNKPTERNMLLLLLLLAKDHLPLGVTTNTCTRK